MDEIRDVNCAKGAPIHDFLSEGKCLEKCSDGFDQSDRVVTKTHTKKVEKIRVKFCTPVDGKGNPRELKLSENAKINRGVLRAAHDIVKFNEDNVLNKFPARVKEKVLYKEDIPGRNIKEGDLRYVRLKISIDPESVETKKDLKRETESLLQSNNYVACASAAEKMLADKNFDDNRIFHAFSMMANIQRKGTLAKDVFNTCRDVAYREVHKKNKNDDKVMAITCDLAIGNRGKLSFVKSKDELDDCCTMVITEQNRRAAEGLRPKPKTIDAIVNQCVALEPRFKSLKKT